MCSKERFFERARWALPAGFLCFVTSLVINSACVDMDFLVGFFEGAAASLILLGIFAWSKLERDRKRREKGEE